MQLVPRRFAARFSDALISLWAKARRNRKVRLDGRPVKLNVGSGLVVAPGWVNMDVSLITLAASWPVVLQRTIHRLLPESSAARRLYTFEQFRTLLRDYTFVHHRVEFGLPFHNDSVDYIFTSHLVEHLYLSHARLFFAESLRVLRSGGVLRICIPDLEHAIKLYNEGHKEEALGYFFSDVGPSEYSRHRYMYDFDLLQSELSKAGFNAIVRRSYRAGDVPDIAVLDNRPEETLYVEATK
jgi:SAM-dependent methyltransferase